MIELRIDEKITNANVDPVSPPEARELHDWINYQNTDVSDPVTVAVMDTGIDKNTFDNHSWFDGSTVKKNYSSVSSNPQNDQVGHGTGVSSIIAKNTPGVEFYNVKIFDGKGTTTFSAVERAYEWMIERGNEIDIVNMSWGASKNIPEINELHERLLQKDVIDVVAAGNSGRDGGSPSTAMRAFSVGAVNRDAKPTRFSSFDPDRGNPDVAAIGKDVAMARTEGALMGRPIQDRWVRASGTSFSAPYTVAAYVNALYRKRMSWDNLFKKHSPDIPGTPKDGGGLLKLKKILDGFEDESIADASSWNFRGNDTLWVEADWIPEEIRSAELMNETDEYIEIRINK